MAKPRGFAAMPKELVSAIASKGGKAAQASGRAHRYTSEEAREAGRKGGLASSRAKKGYPPILDPADAPIPYVPTEKADALPMPGK